MCAVAQVMPKQHDHVQLTLQRPLCRLRGSLIPHLLDLMMQIVRIKAWEPPQLSERAQRHSKECQQAQLRTA